MPCEGELRDGLSAIENRVGLHRKRKAVGAGRTSEHFIISVRQAVFNDGGAPVSTQPAQPPSLRGLEHVSLVYEAKPPSIVWQAPVTIPASSLAR